MEEMWLYGTYRDPKRIKRICELLEKAWSEYPEQRLGQFLLNFVFGSLGRDSHIFNKEDDLIESLLVEFVEKTKAFNELSEVEKKEQRELYLEEIFKQNKKNIDKIKNVYKQNQEFIDKLKDDKNNDNARRINV